MLKNIDVFEENIDEKTRNMLVAAQEQEMQHEWDSKYMLPRIEEFHNILVAGCNESWKILFCATHKLFEYKLYLTDVTNYLLLVVSSKNSKQLLDLGDAFLPSIRSSIEVAFTVGEKIKELLLTYKSKPTLLITGNEMGGYIAQLIAFTITYCFVGLNGGVQVRETPCEDFVTYTVVFDSPPALDSFNPFGALKCEEITLAITNVIDQHDSFYQWLIKSYFNMIHHKRLFEIREVLIDGDANTYKHQTSEGLVEWDAKEIPTSFFTKIFLEQIRKYLFLEPMCPQLVEKIPKCRLLDSNILLEDENVTPEEFIPRTHQVLSKFKDVIDSEIFADKHLKELYEVLTENTREDTHCLVLNEEGKRPVQEWPDGTVIRGFQSYEEMRFYACLYYNSIQKCYYCSYEKFIQINAETINNFASKTKPTIILIVDEDQNMPFQHQTYENMKIIYLVLELDVEKTNNTPHSISSLDKKSQNMLKAITVKYFDVFEENIDEKTRNMLVAAQEQEMQHEWDSKYMLPRIEEFHNILVAGCNESWKILFCATHKLFEYKLYLTDVTNYLLLVVSSKNSKQLLDLGDAFLPSIRSSIEVAFTVGEKIKELLLTYKSKPTLLITGNEMGGYIAQLIAFTITYCFVGLNGGVQVRETPCEDFVTYTVVFDSPPALDSFNPFGALKCEEITLAITNVIDQHDSFYQWLIKSYFNMIHHKRLFEIREVLIDGDANTYKHQTSEGLVEWDAKEIPTSFFTKIFLEQIRKYLFLEPMCPQLVEKIPKCRLLDSNILLEDENVTPEEFIPRTHQVLSKFKDVIDSEIFADKHLKELYEVLTENTREDTHCLVLNEEGKRTVQEWPDGTVIRGFQSYEEMRFYACLYYNSIQKCYYCSYEKFIQINAETINNFASKTKPTIILIVDEDQNMPFQHQTYENMKIIYLVLELDVEKTNNTPHSISSLDKKSQNMLKAITEEKIFYVNHEMTGNNFTETFRSATELVNRLKNEEPKFVVISGEAGMGKSTTLKQIAFELQKEQENFWIVNLDFSQIECQLRKAKQTLNSKIAAVELIRNLELDKLKGNKEVLKKNFDQKMKMKEMVLLIDSFDKISPQCRAEAKNFIQLLRQTGLQMIVTTCPLEANNFSKEEIFELQRFNSNGKKIKFIEQIFKTLKVPVPRDYRVWFKKIFSDVAKDSWNNPSSLIMAVYLYSTDAQLQGERKVNIFKSFLNNSIKKTLGGEMKANESNPLENITNKCNHLLEILAICTVFFDGKVEDQYAGELSEISNFINSFVIAKLESDNKTVSFLHRPFAEYLVARIFIQQYEVEGQSPRLSIEQQKSILMDKTHFEIRQNICGFLSVFRKVQIAHEVIQGNEKKLLELLIEEDRLELFLLLKELLMVAHEKYVIKTCDSKRINLLYLAMKTSSNIFLKQLLDDGAAFESVLQEEFVLHKALEKGLIREVQLHFDELKKDINKADDRRNFPLHYAALNGSKEMVGFLIANGANVNKANASNQTALYFAIQANSLEVVTLLLEKKVDTKFALKWAAELGQEDLLFKFYFEDTNEDGLKQIRIQQALSSSAANGHSMMCQILLSFKGNSAALDEEGETSVHLAAAGGHLDCVQRLLSKKANVNVRNSKGETPLMKALWNDQDDVVEWLLERNADLQAEDAEGIKCSHHMAVFLLSKTIPTEELNDLKEIVQAN